MKPFKILSGLHHWQEVYTDWLRCLPRVKSQVFRVSLVTIVKQEIVDDQPQKITAVSKDVSTRVDLIVCTGGNSVDPDDWTPLAITDRC